MLLALVCRQEMFTVQLRTLRQQASLAERQCHTFSHAWSGKHTSFLYVMWRTHNGNAVCLRIKKLAVRHACKTSLIMQGLTDIQQGGQCILPDLLHVLRIIEGYPRPIVADHLHWQFAPEIVLYVQLPVDGQCLQVA